jgi:hypothetical protein
MTGFATIVDTSALLQTIGAAFVAGVGVAFTFSLAILGAARVAEASRQGHTLHAFAFGALALLGLAASLIAIAFGIVVMTSS